MASHALHSCWPASLHGLALGKAMQSGTDTLRAEAFYSLRKVRSEKARELLLAALGDASEKVRKAAMEALAFRRDLDGVMGQLISVAEKDKDSDVRHAALRIVGRYYGSRSDAREAIDKLAVGDPDKSVQEFARNLSGKSGDKPGVTGSQLLP